MHGCTQCGLVQKCLSCGQFQRVMQICMPMHLPAPAVLLLTSSIIQQGAAEWLLQAAAKTNMAEFSGVSPEGTIPSRNLEGGRETFLFAMAKLCVRPTLPCGGRRRLPRRTWPGSQA